MPSFKKAVGKPAVDPPAGGAVTEFDGARLAATLLAFVAIILLVLDVLTIYHVFNSILALAAAAVLLMAAAVVNLFRWCALDGPKRKVVKTLLLNNGICIANAVALDAFLYIEETYNYFEHTDKQVKFNRRVGALLELFTAALISWTIFWGARTQEKAEPTHQPTGLGLLLSALCIVDSLCLRLPP
jgi:lysylphosphatidylglycerol synthetase-like protein (DUF2156 family)